MSTTHIKVIAFDCFGTVFDWSGVPSHEVREYVRQVHRDEWAPLDLPESWAQMPAHADSAAGILRLRFKFCVVTCSNLPLGLLRRMSDRAGIGWDAIIPLEASRSYKPDPLAYQTVCDVLQVEPANVTIVTAHPDGPDAGGAKRAGMNLQIIRAKGFPQTIIELAERLELR